jgi:ABC-2 type transport system permease protein
MFAKALAFIRKDLILDINYPSVFITRFGFIFIRVAEAYLLAKLFTKHASPYLTQYGGDYFAYAAIGIAFAQFFLEITDILPDAILISQSRGTLEILLTAPLAPRKVIFYSLLWPFLNALISLSIYLVFVFLLRQYYLTIWSILSLSLVVMLALLCFGSLGIMAISFCLIFKQALKVRGVLEWILIFFGGSYFPIALFPGWLQKIAYLSPLPYVLNPIREIMMNGAALKDVVSDLFILSGFVLVLLPVSLSIFKRAIDILKRDGTAAFY